MELKVDINEERFVRQLENRVKKLVSENITSEINEMIYQKINCKEIEQSIHAIINNELSYLIRQNVYHTIQDIYRDAVNITEIYLPAFDTYIEYEHLSPNDADTILEKKALFKRGIAFGLLVANKWDEDTKKAMDEAIIEQAGAVLAHRIRHDNAKYNKLANILKESFAN